MNEQDLNDMRCMLKFLERHGMYKDLQKEVRYAIKVLSKELYKRQRTWRASVAIN